MSDKPNNIDTKALATKIFENATKNAADRKTKIEKALASSRLVLLSFHEFLSVTGYSINKYLVDKFFHSIKDDIPIYIDNELIKWCGYGGELRQQKENLLKLIKKSNIQLIELDNDEYKLFREDTEKSCRYSTTRDQQRLAAPSINDIEYTSDDDEPEGIDNTPDDDFSTIYPEADLSHGKNRTKHILANPDEFKMVVMRLPTARGKQVCKYYIEFERIVREYVKYQVQFLARREELLEIELKESREERRVDRQKAETDRQKAEADHQELRNIIEDLHEEVEDINDKLDCATDDRVPKTIDANKLERFVLMKLNDDDPDTHDYYVIRTQKRSVRTAMTKLRLTFPNAERVMTINYQPNSKNLFNRIKEEMRNNVVYNNNYISPVGISRPNFIREVKKLNSDKKVVE